MKLTEISWEAFLQLNQRTTKRVLIDFNPSEEFWESHLREWEEYRSDTDYFKTTFLDNPFLPEIQVKQILAYKTSDPFRWAVYGLGEFSIKEGIIYKNARQVFTPFPTCKKVAYGLDFGYTNDPTALVRAGLHQGEIYVQQLIYNTSLTNSDIIARLKDLGVSKQDEIFADAAEPKSIEEIRRAGYNIRAAAKGADSVKNGISLLKEYPIVIVDSPDLWKERNNYEWKKDANDKILNVPIDRFNHALDALRYYAIMKLKNSDFKIIH
jgi:phage terminase large subunit